MLKDLAKFVANSQDVRQVSAITKKAPVTPQYQGPLTSHKPAMMKNVQDWMVDPTILQDDTTTCKSNHNPPFTPETTLTLKKLFNTALDMCLTSGHDEDTEPETP